MAIIKEFQNLGHNRFLSFTTVSWLLLLSLGRVEPGQIELYNFIIKYEFFYILQLKLV